MTEILSLFDLTPTDFQMILISVVVFTIYLKLSSTFLFKPLLDHFEARETMTAGAQDAASESLEEASRLRGVYEETIDTARAEAVKEKLSEISKASKEASGIVAQAESEAKATIEAGRKELADMESKLRAELEGDAEKLSQQLADRVLAGPAGASTSLSSFIIGALALTSLFFVDANIALAGGGEGHVPSASDTAVYWPSFLFFFGVAFFYLKKPFGAYWVGRATQIEEAVNAGEKAREAAEVTLQEAKDLYARVDTDVSELKARIANEAKAESERVVSEAKTKAAAIAERAVESKDAEKNNLEVRLREELAERVIAGAEKILAQKIDAGKDAELRGSVVKGASSLLQ